MTCEDSESENESTQFSHYEPNVLRMMESMGYDLTSGPGLNFGEGKKNTTSILRSKKKSP